MISPLRPAVDTPKAAWDIAEIYLPDLCSNSAWEHVNCGR